MAAVVLAAMTDFFASSLHLMDVVSAGLRAPGAQAAVDALGAVGEDAAAAQAARGAVDAHRVRPAVAVVTRRAMDFYVTPSAVMAFSTSDAAYALPGALRIFRPISVSLAQRRAMAGGWGVYQIADLTKCGILACATNHAMCTTRARHFCAMEEGQ